MWRVPDLSRRVREPELLDDPSLDPQEGRRARAGLCRLNRAGNAAGIVWRAVRPLATTPGHGPLSILDIATGSGDIPRGLLRRAHKLGVTLGIHACDVNEYALAEARRGVEQDHDTLTTFRLDAVHEEIPGEYDVVMCSLFTHHLENEQVVTLLYRMRAAAKRLVLVSDLVRTGWSYRLAVAASRVVTQSRIVHVDAKRSMMAAFTIPEMCGLAEEAGLRDAEIVPRWPCRLLLTWRRER